MLIRFSKNLPRTGKARKPYIKFPKHVLQSFQATDGHCCTYRQTLCCLTVKGYWWWGRSWPGWVSTADSGSCPLEEPGPGKLCSAESVAAFDATEGHWWGRWLTRLAGKSWLLRGVCKTRNNRNHTGEMTIGERALYSHSSRWHCTCSSDNLPQNRENKHYGAVDSEETWQPHCSFQFVAH